MTYLYHNVKFMFVLNPYDGEDIKLSDGGVDIADQEGFYQSIKLLDLPSVADIVQVPESNEFWVVSAVIRRPSFDISQFPSSATILLCKYDLYINDDSPYLYVGFDKDGLVGVIGSDRIFKPLRNTRSIGFNWGYIGGGPHHLSEAILFHFLGKMPNENLAQDFSTSVIATLNRETFVIKSKQIEAWVQDHK